MSPSTAPRQSVNYYDEVYFSPAEGALEETTTSLNANGNTQYTTTISYTPDGSHVSIGAHVDAAERRRFHRHSSAAGLSSLNQPVTGVRRITVLVTLQNQSVQPPVTFQMSMVRP